MCAASHGELDPKRLKNNNRQNVSQTLGGKLANHFDNKTRDVKQQMQKSQIDDYYNKLWGRGEYAQPQNATGIMEDQKEQNKISTKE